MATGTLLFDAEAAGSERARVVSNAGWKTPYGSLSEKYQAVALIEVSGDVNTALNIYYETCDIHELPPLGT